MKESPQISKRDAPPGSGKEAISRKEFNEVIRAEELKRIKVRREKLQGGATALSPEDATRPPEDDMVGLALSGGGIRSATFNLGVLQRLAELKVLPLVDYLSTVSGGGFIGGWWSSWMCNRAGTCGGWMPAPDPATPADEPLEVEHLRLYSNYLIPRKGMFSPDTWRAVTVVLRNLLVTQAVVASLLAAVFVLVDAVYAWRVPSMIEDDAGAPLAIRFGLWSTPLIGVVLIWFFLTVVFLCVATGNGADRHRLRTAITRIHTLFVGAVAFLAGLFALAGFSDLLLPWLNQLVSGKGGWVAVLPGIASAIYTAFAKAPAGGGDPARSPASGLKKYVLKLAPALSLFTLAVMLAAGAWWLLRTTFAFMSSPAAPEERGYVFIVSLIIVFGISQVYFLRSLSTHRLGWRDIGKRDPQDAVLVFIALVSLACGVFLYTSYTEYHAEPWWTWLACFLVLAQIAIGAGFASDPNALSLHSFYCSRLVRAYLGAANQIRLDDLSAERERVSATYEKDDLALAELKAWIHGGPVHILNTTLNLVGAKDLTSEQRQAEVFELTPLFCGSGRTGYRRTNEYVDGGLSLGTAVAISGAAASTNMGSNTSVPMAMLMSFFNVRLGYWIANPGLGAWRYPWTRFWLWYQVREMLAQTTAQGKFSFLSDGGHLENLGLYALVKRRCRYIIVCDASADPQYEFGDLANAIRMVRIDFRCEVHLPLDDLRPIPETVPFRRSQTHYAVGDIKYSDGTPPSTLIYLKSSLTNNVPTDVQGYAQSNCTFPHQTTADQFFDEAQFESYRRLGYHVADAAFVNARVPSGSPRTRASFFAAVLKEFVRRVSAACDSAATTSQQS